MIISVKESNAALLNRQARDKIRRSVEGFLRAQVKLFELEVDVKARANYKQIAQDMLARSFKERGIEKVNFSSPALIGSLRAFARKKGLQDEGELYLAVAKFYEQVNPEEVVREVCALAKQKGDMMLSTRYHPVNKVSKETMLKNFGSLESLSIKLGLGITTIAKLVKEKPGKAKRPKKDVTTIKWGLIVSLSSARDCAAILRGLSALGEIDLQNCQTDIASGQLRCVIDLPSTMDSKALSVKLGGRKVSLVSPKSLVNGAAKKKNLPAEVVPLIETAI